MWHFLGALLHKAVAAVTCLFVVCSAAPINLGAAGTQAIRQEVNITDSYLYAGSGSFATSSAMVAITDTNYTSPRYYFEVVASTTAATTATIDLVNATSSAVAATLTINGGNTYQRYRSSAFLPNASSTVEYKIRLNSEAIGKGVIASRIVILQDTSSLTNTETQIEIGSATTTAQNTNTLPLQDPKYWYYNSAGWDGSPTFYAEVSYKTNPVASSTSYNVSATTTSTFYNYIASTGVGYVAVETWGPGGGGDGVTSAATIGGGGGGGGAYARSTTTPAVGSSNRLGLGRGGAEGVAATASTTYTGANGQIVQAAGGTGATSATGAAGGTTGNSTGDVKSAGGSGGNGETTQDIGGGGGGSAGPDGAGGTAANAVNPNATAGAQGDNGLGGAGGAAGTGNNDTCANADGKAGLNNVLGAGGGGGASGDATGICVGGSGGRPGGGGGGSDEGVAEHLGGPGQLKLTEYIGTVGVAIEEDDGNFGTWTFKKQIITGGKTSTTTERVRSASFTPVNGKHYRAVASTTSATASYDIYNAKIVVDQAYNAGGIQLEDTFNESNKTGDTNICVSTACPNQGVGQAFASTGGTLSSAKFYLIKTGAPSGNAVAKLYATSGTFGTDAIPTGAALATSDNLDVTTISTGAFALFTFTFSGANQYAMSNGTKYVISIEYSGGSASNWIRVGQGNGHAGDASGLASAVWSSSGGDTVFYLYGDLGAAIPAPTLLEPQYLLAPFKLFSGTALQDFLTSFDTTEWSTTNNYMHAASAADNSTSVVETDNTTGPATITGSIITSPDNYATSTGMCLTSTAVLAPKATTNNSDLYSDSIIVQVGTASTAVCGPVAPTGGPAFMYVRDGSTYVIDGSLNVRQ